MLKMERKFGAITVEVGIGILLTVIVLFVAIGLFNENLSTMISNSGIANMFKNANKTTYSSFNRDYSASQVNVQLIGEQGLAMLRNIANNKAIAQIEKYFDGTDTSVTNVNSITYLATAINAIVGSPDICVYMKKDSDKKCDQDNIGGYLYKINLGPPLTINKYNTIDTKTATIGGEFSGGATGITVKTSSGGTVRTFQPVSMLPSTYSPISIGKTAIYTYIKNLSFFADNSNTVYDHVILIKALNAGNNTSSDTGIIAQLTQIVNETFPQIQSSLQRANEQCRGSDAIGDLFGESGDHPSYWNQNISECGNWRKDGWGDYYVSQYEIDQTKTYMTNFTNIINLAISTNDLSTINNLVSSADFANFLDLLEDDHAKNSCGIYNATFATLIESYGAPVCTPHP